jgi:hypothetical protein
VHASHLLSPGNDVVASARQTGFRSLFATVLAVGVHATCLGAVATTGDITFTANTAPGSVELGGEATVAGVTFFVDIFSDAGTRTYTNTSQLQAEYPDLLHAPGIASIRISQIPVSSSTFWRFGFNGEIGARGFGLTASENVGFGAVATESGNGSLPSTITSSGDGVGSPAPSIGIPFIAEATASLRLTLEETVNFNSLDGRFLVFYTPPAGTGGELGSFYFDITSSETPDRVDVPLMLPGRYDFWLGLPAVEGTYNSNTQVAATFFAAILGNDLVRIDIPLNNVPQSGTFRAESNFSIEDWFSIEVREAQPPDGVVPEPASLSLWAAMVAAAGVAMVRRRRATIR